MLHVQYLKRDYRLFNHSSDGFGYTFSSALSALSSCSGKCGVHSLSEEYVSGKQKFVFWQELVVVFQQESCVSLQVTRKALCLAATRTPPIRARSASCQPAPAGSL